jgi:hypothetical protein
MQYESTTAYQSIHNKHWISPHECVHHHKPDLFQYRAVGSKCYVLIKRQLRLEKLRSRFFEGWLTGMSASNIYGVWLPQLSHIVISRDVPVDEKIKYNKNHIPPLAERQETTLVTVAQEDMDDGDIEWIL